MLQRSPQIETQEIVLPRLESGDGLVDAVAWVTSLSTSQHVPYGFG